MRRMIMKKKVFAMMMMGVLACSMVACGSQPADNNSNEKEEKEDKDDKKDKDENNDGESADDETAVDSDIIVSVDGDEWKDVRAAYNELVKNMQAYVADCDALSKEYIAYDYMYFDYDGDEKNEVILYLEYREDDEYYRDVVFMNYFEERKEVGILGISYAELNDSSFYAEYDSKMARYSWPNTNESYLYSVAVRDGSLIYVLEDAYDYLLVELEEAGLHPIPLHGDWELLPED